MFRRQYLQAVYLLSAVRTPIGKFGGSLASLTAADIGVVAAKAAIERAGVEPQQVEEAIFGNARQFLPLVPMRAPGDIKNHILRSSGEHQFLTDRSPRDSTNKR